MKATFNINGYQVFPDRYEIQLEQEVVRIEPKVMEVLLYLAAHHDRIVSKEELLSAVWKDTIVIDKVLTRSISELRKVFADNPKAPHIIETIPRSGYRLIAPVEDLGHKPNHSLSWLPWALLILTALTSLIFLLPKENAIPLTYQATPISSFQSWEYDPALSPDGRYLAFVWNGMNNLGWNFNTDNKQSWDIYIKDLQKDTLFKFVEGEGSEGAPCWSKDGQHLIYYRQAGDSAHIYMKSLKEQQSERYLVSCKARYPSLSWSPDNQWIAFNSQDTAEHAIHLLSLITLEQRQLTHPQASIWGDFQCSFSPDGKRLAYTRSYSEGVQELFLYDLLAHKERQLSHLGANVFGHDWMENEKLVVSLNSNGRSELWEWDTKEANPTRIPEGFGFANPDWSPMGIIAEQWTSETNLWLLDLHRDTLTAKPIITSTGWDLHPVFSPSGQQIAFTSNRSGHYEIWTAKAEGTQAKQLTYLRAKFCGTPSWSLDEKRLFFEVRTDGQSDIYAYDFQSQETIRITYNPADDLAPIQTAAETIQFTSNRNQKWQVWEYVADSSSLYSPQTMTSFQLDKSKQLLYTRPQKDGLWLKMEEDSPGRLLLPDLAATDWSNWLLNSEGIYFVKRGEFPLPDELYFYDRQRKSQKHLFTFPARVPSKDRSLALSPDGKQLIFGQINRSACDLWQLQSQAVR